MFKTSYLPLAAGIAFLALAIPASASTPADQITGFRLKSETSLATLTDGQPAPFELARRGRGADDPPGDDRGGRRGRGHGADDGAGHASNAADNPYELARRGRGADDPPGDDHGGRRKGRGHGADDGANHA